jgi:hypothetical protein
MSRVVDLYRRLLGGNAEQPRRSGTAPQESGPMPLLASPFDELLEPLPEAALAVPSMMSIPERQFLYGLAKNYYRGTGVIVDAGIFLGASTNCFGEGLKSNRRARHSAVQRPLISFERGVVSPTMPAFFRRNNLPISLQPGESFAEVTRNYVKPVAELVDLRIGNIMQIGAVDAPIEILFLDVLKLPEIAKYVVEHYYSLLIPDHSIVIQQDYFADLLPYIKTYQEYFSEYFSYVGEISSSAIFKCIKKIPQNETIGFHDRLSAEEQIRLASVALQRSHDPMRRFLMALSKLRLIRRLHGPQAALDYLYFIKEEYPQQMESLARVPRLREALQSAEDYCKPRTAREAEEMDYGWTAYQGMR